MSGEDALLPPWANRQQDVSPPEDWQQVPLATIADIRFSSVDKKSYAGEKPVRLCNYTDVYNNDYIFGDEDFMSATASDSEIARFSVQPGDVIITKDSETPDDIGIPVVIEASSPDLLCGYHLALIRPNQNRVDSIFLAKQLAHERLSRYFARLANGLTRYGLPTVAVENVPVWVPLLGEQQSVAGILRGIDESIAKTESLIHKLKAIKQGLMHDLLTCGLDDNGQLRDSERHPEHFKESPLGLVPRDWTIKPLSDLTDVDRGKFMHRPRNDPRFYGGEHPFVQTGDVAAADGRVLNSFSQTLNARGAIVSQEFPEGTIAITIAANIADTAILGRPMYFPDSIVGAVVKPPNAIRYIELRIRYRKKWLSAQAPQSAQKNINLETLRPLLLPVPNPEEQLKIAEIYDRLDSRIQSEEAYHSKLKAIKKGLMQDLLTGRVRVKDPLEEGD
ncbi:MAG: restriction endonuclease subunit S [Deltaproteobacteria bacterium]|jgi:type I restriction enzyme, S subunit